MVSDFFSDKLKIRKALGRSGNLRKGKKITEFHPPHFTTFKTKLPLSVYLLGEVCYAQGRIGDCRKQQAVMDSPADARSNGANGV